jgi:hypothetical protein
MKTWAGPADRSGRVEMTELGRWGQLKVRTNPADLGRNELICGMHLRVRTEIRLTAVGKFAPRMTRRQIHLLKSLQAVGGFRASTALVMH